MYLIWLNRLTLYEGVAEITNFCGLTTVLTTGRFSGRTLTNHLAATQGIVFS
jgi:hypothetical protein